MSESLALPLLKGILPTGLRFGANYLVEFEPQSVWYETSITLCAQALRKNIRTDYHTFIRPPSDVRRQLEKLGRKVEELEANDSFRIWDSYTVQTGLGTAEKIGTSSPRERVDLRSVKISDWDKGVAEEVKADVPEVEKRRLHIDDNTSVLLQFNDEKPVIEHFRTLTIPFARKLEISAIHSIATNTFSEELCKKFESFCDGIIDFRSLEEPEGIAHYMRVRIMRGTSHDSRWRQLKILENGEVVPGEFSTVKTDKVKEMGVRGWLRGPK